MAFTKLIPIDWHALDELCYIHCTKQEISHVLGVSMDTIERRIKRQFKQTFSQYYEIKSAKGKQSIRRKMYSMAMKGDKTMLIFIAKNWLGMSDHPEKPQEKESITINYINADTNQTITTPATVS